MDPVFSLIGFSLLAGTCVSLAGYFLAKWLDEKSGKAGSTDLASDEETIR